MSTLPQALSERRPLIDAIFSAMDDLVTSGHDLYTTALVVGGLDFALTGADGYLADDATVNIWGTYPGALEDMLFCDLEAHWQKDRPNVEEMQAIRDISKAIADAFMKAYQRGAEDGQ